MLPLKNENLNVYDHIVSCEVALVRQAWKSILIYSSKGFEEVGLYLILSSHGSCSCGVFYIVYRYMALNVKFF